MKVLAGELGVIGLSVVRLAIAALALLAVARFARVRLPERRHALRIITAAFVGMPACQLVVNAGELHVPAGAASLFVSVSPLVSVALATLTRDERLRLAKFVGSAVARPMGA